jgi:hypothetical protein
MAALITRTSKGEALSFADGDANWVEIDRRTGTGWKDLVASFDTYGIPVQNLPEKQPFGPSGLRRELVFGIGEYAFCSAFHINHDIKINGKAYIHVHWSSDGADVAPVKWEFQVSRALGHQQAYFTSESSMFVQQAAYGGAWRHMVAEVSIGDALTLTEPDELILVTLRRVTNGAVDNTDQIFALTVDIHYESDRDTTPNKSPNFYA